MSEDLPPFESTIDEVSGASISAARNRARIGGLIALLLVAAALGVSALLERSAISDCIERSSMIEEEARAAMRDTSLTAQQLEALEDTAIAYSNHYWPKYAPFNDGNELLDIADACREDPSSVSLTDGESRIAIIRSMPKSESGSIQKELSFAEQRDRRGETQCSGDHHVRPLRYLVVESPLERWFTVPVHRFYGIELISSGFGACGPSQDLDCIHIQAVVTGVPEDDPHGLDADNDGIGCEEFYDSPTIHSRQLSLFQMYATAVQVG